MSTTTVAARPWRLGARARKAVLVTHVASGGAWLGLDLSMGVLVGTALLTDDDSTRAAAFQLVGAVGVAPVLVVGLLALASGVLLGIGTKWGVVRYRWVAVKLAVTVVLLALVVLALRPGAAELADRGRLLAAGTEASASVGDMVFPPVVSTVALLGVLLLSVFKPWGRLRGARRR